MKNVVSKEPIVIDEKVKRSIMVIEEGFFDENAEEQDISHHHELDMELVKFAIDSENDEKSIHS